LNTTVLQMTTYPDNRS